MKNIIVLICLCFTTFLNGQSDLFDLLSEQESEKSQLALATFKGSRLINGHTIMTRKKGTLEFLIAHRFGLINSGAYELFGLDNSNIRFGIDYGLLDNLTVGFGRNSFEKSYDGFVKFAVIRQQTGKRNIPFSITAFSSLAINTLRAELNQELDFTDRVAFTFQGLIGRKLNPSLSLQLTPTLIHFNKVTGTRMNKLYAIGLGGRIKLTSRLSLNTEYYYRFTERDIDLYHDSFAIGVDLETGGHIFQFHLTNSRAMIEKGFARETTGNFFSGDIHLGFNITRSF